MSTVLQKIEKILQSSYDITGYISLVNEIFAGFDFISPNDFQKEYSNFSSHIEGITHIGNYKTADNKKIIILSVQLKRETYVENARSIQRSFAKKLIENSNADAAFIAFYTDGDNKWRLSLVRLDYEIKLENSKLKTTEKLTPAKRYSYLVGEAEPCHTAISRFSLLLTKSEAKSLTLNDLEDAFSVEKVTDEFFKLYCEKFHQLREHLENNDNFKIEAEQHNFTAAQFAKKLLGQIVFLYFLQKKGWLGVKAWPKTLTDKEYKKAYFARGSKSRELIPIIYKLKENDGLYYLTNTANKISNEDEAILASCVKGKPWGSGPHNFMRKLFEVAEKRKLNFFDDLLEPLFYEALNVNRGEQGYYSSLHCRIPFLSGGLFEPIDGYEWKYNNFDIPNDLFSNAKENGVYEADGILDVFDRYNFTISEDEPMEREVAIDPEMLGKVFENLLEVQDRKSKGAFYTPREIVHYICRESLINYLTYKLQVDESAVRDFILYGDYLRAEDTDKNKRIENGGMLISEQLFLIKDNGEIVVNKLKDMDLALKDIRVSDPAVGSGAFLLGMLNEIVRARQNISAYFVLVMKSKGLKADSIRNMYNTERSPWSLKYNTIKNCIFAADIDPSAVDIAQLRLWLSLVIDNEINPNAQTDLEGTKNPLPLPNLECNILCGNSLIDEFEGIKLINESELLGNAKVNSQIETAQWQIDFIVDKLIDKQSDLYSCDDTNKKKQLKDEIDALRDEVIMMQMRGCTQEQIDRYEESKKLASKPYVLWQLDFAKVFREKGGFDVVIGNPPYVDSETMTNNMPEVRKLLSNKFYSTKGNWDLFIVFIEKGINILSLNGLMSYIVPNKLISAPYSKSIREQMANYQIIEIRDYSKVDVFKSAAVYPIVFQIKKTEPQKAVKMSVMKDIKLIGNDGAVFNPADNATCIALGSGNAGISTEDSDNDGVGLLIANFTFTGLGFSISTSGPNTYNDVVIQGCDFSGAEKQNAISIYNYTNPEFINDVTVEGCSFSTYESAVLMFELNNATVRDNTFRNVEFGVNFSGAANKTGTLLIEDNISIGNTDISEWGGNAFVVQGPDNATIILRGNRIYDHEPESILYVANGYGSPKLTAEDNIYYSSEGSTAGIKLQEVSNEDISQVANGGSLTIKKDGTIKRSWTT